MPYENFLLLSVALIFTLIYLFVLAYTNKNKPSLFEIIIKDISPLIIIVFIFMALTTNQVLTSIVTTYNYNNMAQPLQISNTITNYAYSHDTTLDSSSNGFQYALGAIFILFLANMLYEVYDYLTKKK